MDGYPAPASGSRRFSTNRWNPHQWYSTPIHKALLVVYIQDAALKVARWILCSFLLVIMYVYIRHTHTQVLSTVSLKKTLTQLARQCLQIPLTEHPKDSQRGTPNSFCMYLCTQVTKQILIADRCNFVLWWTCEVIKNPATWNSDVWL